MDDILRYEQLLKFDSYCTFDTIRNDICCILNASGNIYSYLKSIGVTSSNLYKTDKGLRGYIGNDYIYVHNCIDTIVWIGYAGCIEVKLNSNSYIMADSNEIILIGTRVYSNTCSNENMIHNTNIAIYLKISGDGIGT